MKKSKLPVSDWQRLHPKSKAIERFFRSWGRLGGKTAAENMTRAERRERAKRAVAARERQRELLRSGL